MKTYRLLLSLYCTLCLAAACVDTDKSPDAYGNFEAVELLISAESNGKILALDIEEGDQITKGSQIGLIDTVPLHLERQALYANIQSVYSKLPDVTAQINVLRQQLETATREEARFRRLLAANAATEKQVDDLTAQVHLLKKQIAATSATLGTQERGLLSEIAPLEARIALLDDAISRARITPLVSGTVLTKLAHAGEMISSGKPLFKMADMSTLICRAYVSGAQLGEIKLGQRVTVSIDASDGTMRPFEGIITWVSPKAEFTPKIVQTKEQRVGLVYAVKIAVANDGSLKIGMPAEVTL